MLAPMDLRSTNIERLENEEFDVPFDYEKVSREEMEEVINNLM